MNNILKKLFVSAMVLLVGVCVAAGEKNGSVWSEDYAQVRKIAEQKKLPILMLFSGSDWCPPCIKLDKAVFHQQAFTRFAKSGKVVLFHADFPRRKAKPQKIAEQNKHLMRVYKVRGVPTVVLTDANGKEFARTGYRPGGAKSYIAHLRKLLKKAPK